MKSNLFSKNDLLRNEDFAKDIKVLLELTPDVLERLPQYVLQTMAAPAVEYDLNTVRDRAAAELGVVRAKLDHAIEISAFFIGEFTTFGDAQADEPEHVAADIEELMTFDQGKRAALSQYLADLKQLAEKEGQNIYLRKEHAKSVLPNLRSFAAAVDYRVVFDKYPKMGQAPHEYSAECRGAIPLGIARMTFTKANVKEVVFQLDKHQIAVLIDRLRTLEKQFEMAESHLNLAE